MLVLKILADNSTIMHVAFYPRHVECLENLFMHVLDYCSFQSQITLKCINGLYPGVTTVELDNLAAETAAAMTVKHPDYAILAARIAVSNLHKETKKVFSGENP